MAKQRFHILLNEFPTFSVLSSNRKSRFSDKFFESYGIFTKTIIKIFRQLSFFPIRTISLIMQSMFQIARHEIHVIRNVF